MSAHYLWYDTLLIISGVLLGASLHTAGLMLFDTIKSADRGWVSVVAWIMLAGAAITSTVAFHL